MKYTRVYTVLSTIFLLTTSLSAQDPANDAVVKAFAIAGIANPAPQEVAAFSDGLNPANIPVMAQAVTMYVQSKSDVACFRAKYRTGMSIDDIRAVCPPRK